MDRYEEEKTINVGSGDEVTILELAGIVSEVIGYRGKIVFDSSKPDGTPRKVLDSSRIRNLGWKPKHSLADGIRTTYEWVLKNGVFKN
jgi:GDP-L-fucose synthase